MCFARRVKLVFIVLLAVALGGADVMPGCGSRHHVRNVAPGDPCGEPSRCFESTTCAQLDQPLTRGGVTTAYVCTKACGSDADCGGLSVRMRCTGTGKLAGPASQPVCLPTLDSAPRGP